MSKEVFIALIQKDIRELDMITKGLYETETISPTIVKLAASKAQEVVDNLTKLAEIKPSALVETTSVVEEKTIEKSIEDIPIVKEDLKETTEEIPVVEEMIAIENEQEEGNKIEELLEEVLEEKIAKPSSSTNESPKPKDDSFAHSLANKKINDIKKAISIGDRFRFQSELFNKNADIMNEALNHLNNCESLENANEYLSNFNWKEENETVEDFMNLVNRLFINE